MATPYIFPFVRHVNLVFRSTINAAASVAFVAAFLLAMVLMSRRRQRSLFAFRSLLICMRNSTTSE
jgi:hypothetical protein